MIQGDFRFGEILSLSTPVTLTLPAPPKRPGDRYRALTKSLPWKSLATELGLVGVHGLGDDRDIADAPDAMTRHDRFEGKPGWWWPDDGAPLLLVPHVHRVEKDGSPESVATVTLVRIDPADGRAQALTLDVTTASQHGARRASYLQSGVGLRGDGKELFVLSQIVVDGSDDPPTARRLCRVRVEQGGLRMACADRFRAIDP
jgi:hypothetical protein